MLGYKLDYEAIWILSKACNNKQSLTLFYHSLWWSFHRAIEPILLFGYIFSSCWGWLNRIVFRKIVSCYLWIIFGGRWSFFGSKKKIFLYQRWPEKHLSLYNQEYQVEEFLMLFWYLFNLNYSEFWKQLDLSAYLLTSWLDHNKK